MKDRIDIKIYYEDTDCGGVVYYGKYLGYLERSRTEYLENRGIRLTDLMSEGVHFIVVHVDIDYKMPARYGDIISVFADVSDMTPATITFCHSINRKENDDLIAVASVKLACIGSTMKPQKIKGSVADALKKH